MHSEPLLWVPKTRQPEDRTMQTLVVVYRPPVGEVECEVLCGDRDYAFVVPPAASGQKVHIVSWNDGKPKFTVASQVRAVASTHLSQDNYDMIAARLEGKLPTHVVTPTTCVDCPLFEVDWESPRARCNHPSHVGSRLPWIDPLDWPEEMIHPLCPRQTVTVQFGPVEAS